MLISENMQTNINEHVNKEQYSAHLYLAMAAAFERMGLKVFAQYYYKQVDEETMHAMKMFKYLVDVGATVELKGIDAPPTKYDSVKAIVDATLEHEIKVTRMINDLVALAEKEKDYTTRSFLQWYVDEQVEEVSSSQELVDLVKITPPHGVLELENRIEKILAARGAQSASER